MHASTTTSPSPASTTNAAGAAPPPSPSHLLTVSPSHTFPPRPHIPDANHPPLARLSTEDGVWILEYVKSGRDLQHFAELVNQTIATILNWIAQPHVQLGLEMFSKSDADRRRHKSMNNLEELLDNADDPVEQRRLNTVILRACNQRPPRHLLTSAGASPPPTSRASSPRPRSTAPALSQATNQPSSTQHSGVRTQDSSSPSPFPPDHPFARRGTPPTPEQWMSAPVWKSPIDLARAAGTSFPLNQQPPAEFIHPFSRLDDCEHPNLPRKEPGDHLLPKPSPGNDPRQQIELLNDTLCRTFYWPTVFARALLNFLSPRTTHPTDLATFSQLCKDQFAICGYDYTIEVSPIRTRGDASCTTAIIKYHYQEAGRRSHFQLEMSRSRDGPHPNTWLIDTITTLKLRERINP